MTSDQPSTFESSLNTHLAKALRRFGLDAHAEQWMIREDGSRIRADIIVVLEESVVVLEQEYTPARTVRKDVERLWPAGGNSYSWNGKNISSTYAVECPRLLADSAEGSVEERLHSHEGQQVLFGFTPVSSDGESINWGKRREGSLRELADELLTLWRESSGARDIDGIVELVSLSVEKAAAVLRHAPAIRQLENEIEGDAASTCSLVWLNALMFQHLLARYLPAEEIPAFADLAKRPQVSRPAMDDSISDLEIQWRDILQINWYPIFSIALSMLEAVDLSSSKQVLDVLKSAAAQIAEHRVIRNHDIAGRIYHRLLDDRKFLATNYTSLAAASMLATLAFDERAAVWKEADWGRVSDIANLRIVDPACGSGTLLIASLQEILRRISHAPKDESHDRTEGIREILENVLIGYDVVPGAVHLTSTALHMAETTKLVTDIPIHKTPYDVRDGMPRLGSLDFLKSAPNYSNASGEELFVADSFRVSGRGGIVRFGSEMPQSCDMIICNPPYTRAGGPGTPEFTAWNPLFGNILSSQDRDAMGQALQRTLAKTPASMYAGLSSAFLVLANQRIRENGRLAFVLPTALLTGSRWAGIREMLAQNFEIDWVIVSQDTRTRAAKRGRPGRLYVAFSESTRIAEVLIVATKKKRASTETQGSEHRVRFVVLHRLPEDPLSATAFANALMANGDTNQRDELVSWHLNEVGIGASMTSVKQSILGREPWYFATFCQHDLVYATWQLQRLSRIGNSFVPLTTLSEICHFGPYHMQVKGRSASQGLFDAEDVNESKERDFGIKALWHHDHRTIVNLLVDPNARLNRRKDKNRADQDSMLKRAANLHFALELRHAPQRLSAALTKERVLSFSSWLALRPKREREGVDEILCLWFNSTPGMLLRLSHANRPYLGRSRLTHELAATLPVLNTDDLSAETLKRGKEVFQKLRNSSLEGFAKLQDDPTRRAIDKAIAELLNLEEDSINELASLLAAEPNVYVRH